MLLEAEPEQPRVPPSQVDDADPRLEFRRSVLLLLADVAFNFVFLTGVLATMKGTWTARAETWWLWLIPAAFMTATKAPHRRVGSKVEACKSPCCAGRPVPDTTRGPANP